MPTVAAKTRAQRAIDNEIKLYEKDIAYLLQRDLREAGICFGYRIPKELAKERAASIKYLREHLAKMREWTPETWLEYYGDVTKND